MRRLLFLLLSLCVFFLSYSNAADPEHWKVTVSPEVLVSRDGDIPHVELIIASNPVNAQNLVGAAITLSSAKGSFATKTYASTDGGTTWNHVSFPELNEAGGLDPQVAFGSKGTAYFCSIRYVKDEKQNDRAG